MNCEDPIVLFQMLKNPDVIFININHVLHFLANCPLLGELFEVYEQHNNFFNKPYLHTCLNSQLFTCMLLKFSGISSSKATDSCTVKSGSS